MDLDSTCRMCSSEKSRVKSIFHDYAEQHLEAIITDVLQLNININDGLPSNICKPCASTIFKIRDNIERFRNNEKSLRRKFNGEVKAASAEDEIETVEFNADLILKEEPDEKDKLFSTDGRSPSGDELPLSQLVVIKQEAIDQPDDTKARDSEVDAEAPSDDNNAAENDNDDSCDSTESEHRPVRKGRKRLPKAHQDDNSAESDEVPTRRKMVSRRQYRRDPNRPKMNDHKCYICKSESMGSAKALLEHLSIHLHMMPQTCAECVMETVVLKNVRSLNVHKKMHAQPIKCEYCDRRYSDAWARDGHVKTYHLGESAPCPSTCDQCGKVCKSISALKSHMRDHKLDVKCHQCGKMFHRHSKLREHVTRVHEKAEKYECNICNHVVHSLESYNSHLKMHNAEKTYNCDLCPMKFYTAGNLGLHKKVHAKNANYKPHKDWTSHYTVSQDPDRGKIYTCNHCGNTYTGSINTIISHVKHHFKDLKCDQCDLKFTNKHKLKIHYVVHTRERNYKCEYCGKDFLYRTHMTHHIKHKHQQMELSGVSGTDNLGTLADVVMAGSIPRLVGHKKATTQEATQC